MNRNPRCGRELQTLLPHHGHESIAPPSELQEPTWVPPASLHDAVVRGRAAGQLFDTILNGVRTMPAYGRQIPRDDAWAIVAYVRALQRSQNATTEDVPPAARAAMGL